MRTNEGGAIERGKGKGNGCHVHAIERID